MLYCKYDKVSQKSSGNYLGAPFLPMHGWGFAFSALGFRIQDVIVVLQSSSKPTPLNPKPLNPKPPNPKPFRVRKRKLCA